MSAAAGGGSEDRKKMIAVAAFLIVAVGVLYYELHDAFGSSTPAPVVASAPVAPVNSGAAAAPKAQQGTDAKAVATTSAALDPTLHMEAMLVSESVVYSGSGRNIFSPNSVPVFAIPPPIGPGRPKTTTVTVVTPPPPPPPPPTCPPSCAPIPLKYFGVESSANGKRHAFLLHDDAVYLAVDGDVVLRRYRVITVEAKSILVEDMQTNNRQTLPLLAE